MNDGQTVARVQCKFEGNGYLEARGSCFVLDALMLVGVVLGRKEHCGEGEGERTVSWNSGKHAAPFSFPPRRKGRCNSRSPGYFAFEKKIDL